MGPMTEKLAKHHDSDKAVTHAIKQQMHDQGITSYPAICDECHGNKRYPDGSTCQHCDGQGSYEMAV